MLSRSRSNAVSDQSDEALGLRAKEDFGAFAELYRRHLCPIYKFMRSRSSDDATAEDLTAQVFFRALSSAGTFRGDGGYRSWLFQIAYNTLATWSSRKDRLAVGMEGLPDPIDHSICLTSHAIALESKSTVWRTVASLSPAQSEVVRMRYLEDLTTEEISQATQRSHGAVRVLLHRARTKLRHALEGADL